jgi:hypothetical protein
MLSLPQKITHLENYLSLPSENYADGFKTDILFFIDEFDESNSLLSFLHDLENFEAIETWVGQLTSRIVMKFDEESEDIHDFIYDYIELG